MSWQACIEVLMGELRHGGKLTSVAIVGQDGGIWAQSETFPRVIPAQIDAIMEGFESFKNFRHPGDGLGNGGLCLGKLWFRVADGDESIMRGRGGPDGCGCSVKRTEKVLVIGIYMVSGHVPVDADITVEQLGDFLIKNHL